MTHYILEYALWTLLAFAVGCVIGWLLRSLFAGHETAAPRIGDVADPTPEPIQPVAPAVPRLVEVEPAAAPPAGPEVTASVPRMDRPRGLPAARGGVPDPLQRIVGIGPKNEKILHSLGFFHFDQIAAWTVEQVAWVDDHLKFNGRIVREQWIEQARLLASGAEEEFERRFGSGRGRGE